MFRADVPQAIQTNSHPHRPLIKQRSQQLSVGAVPGKNPHMAAEAASKQPQRDAWGETKIQRTQEARGQLRVIIHLRG